jgi:hypothetical protein
MKAGDAYVALQATAAAQVATLKAAGGAVVPVVSTGTRERSTRTDKSRRSRYIDVAGCTAPRGVEQYAAADA